MSSQEYTVATVKAEVAVVVRRNKGCREYHSSQNDADGGWLAS